ncbi:hypothetical protein AAVH_11201, partial [Aphelenchoides avenae]
FLSGDETLTRLYEATWIGLQVGTLKEIEVENEDGNVIRSENQTGCYWPTGVRPRLAKNDPCPENAVEECSITYNDTFKGLWEDGTLYDEDESSDFWGPDAPDQIDRGSCFGKIFVDEQSRAYCERGVDGKPDRLQHCALILPPHEKQFESERMKQYAGKWSDYWCWMKVRSYICQRPAKRSGGSEDSTARTLTSIGVHNPQSTLGEASESFLLRFVLGS